MCIYFCEWNETHPMHVHCIHLLKLVKNYEYTGFEMSLNMLNMNLQYKQIYPAKNTDQSMWRSRVLARTKSTMCSLGTEHRVH